jgi:futalosine hydrolase
MRALVITAVAAERDAVTGGRLSGAGLPYGAVTDGSVVVAAAGAGPVAAAVACARLLPLVRPELVISAGIAGGFAGRAAIGDVVVASESLFADLGAATDEGFLSMADLGFSGGSALPSAAAAELARRLGAGCAPVLTLATMTGTDAGAATLAAAHPTAVAEAMEGYGVAWAASEVGVPWAEVRAISNLIGRRDRSTWNIPAAFAALGRAISLVVSR